MYLPRQRMSKTRVRHVAGVSLISYKYRLVYVLFVMLHVWLNVSASSWEMSTA